MGYHLLINAVPVQEEQSLVAWANDVLLPGVVAMEEQGSSWGGGGGGASGRYEVGSFLDDVDDIIQPVVWQPRGTLNSKSRTSVLS